MQARVPFRFYLLLFGFSGFAGLIYESIWTQYLKLLLGHSAYAQLLVLVIFMGGMALGAWFASQQSSKIKNLLKAYAIVELLLGVAGIFFHSLFTATYEALQNNLISILPSSFAASAMLWFIGALIILPQCILLGATFPLMTGAILRTNPHHSGKSIAMLYFVNSLGGALGILLSGFYMIGFMGLPGTILTAGLLNILIAVCVWFTALPHSMTPIASNKISTVLNAKILLGCAFLTGFSSFLYEIGWIRMLSMILGSSTHAFEIMLSAFILGLAFGSLYICKIIEKIKSPLKMLAYTQIVMGLMALLTLPIYNFSFEPFAFVLRTIPKTDVGYGTFNAFTHGFCWLFMLPTTFCAGMTLPLLTEILLRNRYGEKSIGQVYAFNTLGAICGAIFAQQLIMPAFGLKTLIGMGALIDIVLGLVLLYNFFHNFYQTSFIISSAFSILFAAGILVLSTLSPLKMASGVFRAGTLLPPDLSKVLFHKDGKTSTISVIKGWDILMIGTNGKIDASMSLNKEVTTPDEMTQILLAVLPWSHHSDARQAAVIGFGSGMTTSTLLNFPSLERVDTIEIEPVMIEGAKLFEERVKKAFEDKRSHIVIDDARTYFSRTKNQYDLIISEPSNPWVSGVSSLFTDEFYQNIKKNLMPRGIFAQWIHLYEISPDLVALILNTLAKNFKDYTAYFTNEGDLLILASQEEISKVPSEKIFLQPEIKNTLERMSIRNVNDISLHKLGDRELLEILFNTYTMNVNSDFFPALDLGVNKARFLSQNFLNLIKLKSNLISLSLLKNEGSRERLKDTTINKYFPLSIGYQNAMSVYNTLIHDPKTEAQDYKTHLNVSELDNKDALCQGRVAEIAWVESFRAILDGTLPYLTKEQTKKLWERMTPKTCISKASIRVYNWVKLYDHLINENYEALLNQANNILTQKEFVEDHLAVLEFKLFAHYKLKNLKEVKSLLWQYSLDPKSSLQLRLLTGLLVKS